jgi:hypothetical protein
VWGALCVAITSKTAKESISNADEEFDEMDCVMWSGKD